MNLKGRLAKLEQRRDDNHPPERIPVFISPGDDEKMAAWREQNPGKLCYRIVCRCGRACPVPREDCADFGGHSCREGKASA